MPQVIVVAGPSGSGKSRLCRRLGLPTLNLDDFYKDGDDPNVDWDSPESWNTAAAVAAILELATSGTAEVPTYDISTSRRTGLHRLDLAGSQYFLAEGIFAPEIVAECRRLGLLADAVCVTQHPVLTFVRRLGRDLREHRKPPLVLLRRGLRLALHQRRVVDRAVVSGCRVVSPEVGYIEINLLLV
ncbi:MAG: ATP-binding protein [Marmoricola sp.]|nr:ATP-binding protein [Marmoricola sp.]